MDSLEQFPADADISLFWHHLSLAEETSDNTLVLLNDSCWLGEESFKGRLFIRAAYQHIFALLCPALGRTNTLGGTQVHADWATVVNTQRDTHARHKTEGQYYDTALVEGVPGIRRWLLTGTPGIGKTFCFFYILWQLSKAHKTCWYKNPLLCGGNWLVFTYNEAGNPIVRMCAGASMAFVLASKDPAHTIVYDACDIAGIHQATTLVISSPKWSRYSGFITAPDVCHRYLPLWSHEELHTCARTCYGDDSHVDELYAYAGGIARVVLQPKDKRLDELKQTVSRVDLGAVVATTAKPDSGDDACHSIVHIHVYADLSTTRVQFASDVIAAVIADRLSHDPGMFARWFIAANDNPTLHTYRAILFGKHAHTMVQRGGTSSAVTHGLLGTGEEEAGHVSGHKRKHAAIDDDTSATPTAALPKDADV
jgi:hypothetical protein